MNKLPLLQTGSVKDIYGEIHQSPYVFKYSDRYSVFDWGEMPDRLSHKGKSLAAIANFFFEILGSNENWKKWNIGKELTLSQNELLIKLKTSGISHHGIGLVDDQAEVTADFTDSYAVKPMNIVRPEFLAQEKKYDYSHYNGELINTLVPLEIIFRFDITKGSSLLNRTNDLGYLNSIGLTKGPKPGDHFENPIIEFSTKLESTDRYITLDEAKKISHMTNEEVQELRDLSSLLALRLKDLFKEIDVNLHDGKFEFAFADNGDGKRTFQLIDSIGPDELRLTYDGTQLSKECLRHFYRDSDWYRAVEKSKQMAKDRGTPDWKDICIKELDSRPPALTSDYKENMTMMYKSLTNALYKKFFSKEVFTDCWDLKTLISKMPK